MSAWPIVSTVVGWVYISAWSVSFYPQLVLNYRRRSVTGLSCDFLVLNVLGFLCYSIYTVAFISSTTIKEEYRQRHPTGHGPAVRANDAVFALHALLISSSTLSQAYLLHYERSPDQRISFPTKCFMLASIFVVMTLAVLTLGDLHWIDVLYGLSYIKLLISFGKLIPQLWLNYRRESTVGWSIANVLLDLTGGSLSLLQLFIDCAVVKDWSALTGNMVKTGLGLLSVAFNIFFITQHYILYPHKDSIDALEDTADPSETERLISDPNTSNRR